MGRASRNKGASAERELANLLRAYGWPQAHRTSDGRGQAGRGDIAHGPQGVHLEAKRHETVRVLEWCRQAEAECSPTDVPVVAFRPSREPWRAVLLLDDLLPILKLREIA